MKTTKNNIGAQNPSHDIIMSFLCAGLPEKLVMTEWKVSHFNNEVSTDEYLNAA